jgi:hypothetical protein
LFQEIACSSERQEDSDVLPSSSWPPLCWAAEMDAVSTRNWPVFWL